MISLRDKIVLVTGGGSGIGRASASIMAAHGAKLVVSDLRLDTVRAVVERFERIDILHNNAALTAIDVIAQDTDILSIPTALWDRVMAVTLRGPMLGCRYAVREMLETGGGSIINTSSIFGLSAHNQQVAYGCAKAGVNRLTEYVATAFGQQGIRCNAVAPSLIMTPAAHAFIPEGLRAAHLASTLMPYLGEPEDVGHVVAFLASDEARFITGQVVRVDGGTMAHLPTYADAKRFYESSRA
jgi:NAD(P)-dependent dehydrogenase (short-subunit alcohol dehydrogenase family)